MEPLTRPEARALSGRPVSELTVDLIADDEVTTADIRIHPEMLEHQAEVAERYGNPQLAENLRRAAELVALDDAELLGVYDSLRPGRCDRAELEALADDLASRGLTRNAALVREAAEVYAGRGLA